MIDEYAAFSRSFTKIRAQDIRDQIDAAYATRKYWPEPILQINPHYKRDKTVADLVREAASCMRAATWSSPAGSCRTHQVQSIHIARARAKLRRHDRHGVRQVASASSCRSSTPCCAARTSGRAAADARDRRLPDERAGQQPDRRTRRVLRTSSRSTASPTGATPDRRTRTSAGASPTTHRTSCSPTS